MSLHIELKDHQPHEVTLTRSGNLATVWIDDVGYPTEFTAEGAATVIEIDGRRETIFTVVDRDTLFVHAFGRSWTLLVSDPVEQSMRGEQSSDAATAPMPGVLVSVSVNPGDPVTKGQVLAIIESMKMHTDISSPRDGVVDRILGSIGSNFDVGAPLVTLVPEVESEELQED